MNKTNHAPSRGAKNQQSNYSVIKGKSKAPSNAMIRLPQELTCLPQWVLWQLRDNKKIPLNLNYYPTDPTKGFTYSAALAAYNPTKCDGLGFITGNGIVCIDLDHCITNGQLNPLAESLVNELDTYTEISQSGTGLHLFFIDSEAGYVNKRITGMEIYSGNHYIAMTGNKWKDTPDDLKTLTGKTNAILTQYFSPVRREPIHTESTTTNSILNQLEQIADTKFKRLFYDGDIAGYPSQSEADIGLMCKLYTYTQGNESQMIELFSQSALGKRDKWMDREDYRQKVVNQAIQFMKNNINPCITQLQSLLQQETIEIRQIFNESVMNAIATCKLDPDVNSQSTVLQIREKCKKCKLPLKDFDEQVNLAVKKLILHCSKTESNHSQEILQNLLIHKNLKLPVDYTINLPDNIFFDWENHKTIEITPDGNKRVLFDSINLIVRCFTDNDTSEEKLQVATLKTNHTQWKQIIAVRELFANSSKIVSLATAGLDVCSINAIDMVKYLKRYESVNSANIPMLKTITRTGWVGNEFVYPLISSPYVLDDSIKPTLDKAFKSKGNKETVLLLIKEMKQIPIANIVMGAMLSAPLVHVLLCDNIVIHVYGLNGSGKSITFNFSFSLFGNPNAKNVNPTADTTKVGLENYFASRYDLPAVIEDLNSASDIKTQNILAKVPYQFGNGEGRLRGNLKGGNQKLLEFRGSLVTNGEKPLTTFTSEGGGKRRVIELSTPDEMLTIPQVKKITDTIKENYGLFGADWIEMIQTHNPDELKQTYNQLFEAFLAENPNKVPRHLMNIAAITTANIYFDVWFLNDSFQQAMEKEMMCARLTIQQFVDKTEIADYIRAKQLIVEWIASHPKNFADDPNNSEGYELWGIQRNDYIAVFPTYLRHLLENNGMSADIILKQLSDAEFITTDKKQLTKLVKINGKPIRMYIIESEKLSGN